jgi:multicomponent Na+:H+ antiporter subunit E
MIYLPGLIIAVAALWFALSGETAPLFLVLAAASFIATLWLCARLGIIDRDASPYHRFHLLIAYAGWLMIEIVKANVVVIRAILSPRSAISPAIVKVKPEGQSDLARSLFANSITLTPGTVTIDTDGDFLVHCLQEDNARPSAFATMNRLAARAAGGRR